MSQFLRDQLDAGAPLDAVVARDTGPAQDTPTPRDLGDEAIPPRDAPVDAKPSDATVAEDRVAPTEDAPVDRDVAPADTGVAAPDAGRPVPLPVGDGCRCRAAAPPRSLPAGSGLLVALGLALLRRRRLPPR